MSELRVAQILWAQCIRDNHVGFREPSSEFMRLLSGLLETSVAETVEQCAEVAEKWSEQYPEKVFPSTGTSEDCRSADMARHTCAMVAEQIRRLLQDDT